MVLKLGQLRIGKVDGKHEYLAPVDERDRSVFDAFLIPESVTPSRMHNGDVYFIAGFRGTGKTSLLRWHAEQQRSSGAVTDFILFKTDLTETQRQHISSEVGITWVDLEPRAMEIAQDFKDAWTWFILHKVGENLRDNRGAFEDYNGDVEKAIRLLGLNDSSILKKAAGFMPRLEGAKVKIRADIKFFEAELGGDFRAAEGFGHTTLNALSSRVLSKICSASLIKPFYVYFDELEAFYHTPEQHRRDQRMVRDLLFAVSFLNDRFRAAGSNIHVLAAVRSEVLGAMGALGQEVDRLVHDRGFLISWHHARKSMSHPLMQIVSRKLTASEKEEGVEISTDPITKYFPDNINGEPIDTFMLDRSFYKPRDLVWRLSIAQKLFPNETGFNSTVLHETEVEYSNKLWDEVRYELSATYSDEEVDAIESAIAGGSASFELEDIAARFKRSAEYSRTMEGLLSRRSVREILSDLYRLGALGNSFRAGSTGNVFKNRWAFRGDPSLLADKRMVIHPALLKRLSVISTRRRGTR